MKNRASCIIWKGQVEMLSGKSSNQRQKVSFLILPKGFSVADAYATGGQVVAADQVGNTGNSNGESGNWQDNLNQWRTSKRRIEEFRRYGERRRSGNW